jgi:hypothetical protein
MSGPRQAAVALHGYTPHDREWLLDALGQEHGMVLRGYLAELDELGFSRPGLGEGGMVAPTPPGNSPLASAAALTSSLPLELLRKASTDEMHKLLGTESCALIGQVVAMDAWTWKNGLLSRFSEESRNRILKHAGASQGPAAIGAMRREFLLTSLSVRLKAIQSRRVKSTFAVPAIAARLKRLLGSFQSWK